MNRRCALSVATTGGVLLAFLALLGGGCGGGGGSGGGTGEVTLLIADAPDEEYESIFLTIHEVSLIPGGVVLYKSASGKEVDLLDLRDEDFVLVRGEVPARRYNKVRLRASGVRTIGGPCDGKWDEFREHKIDLLPRGPFNVEPGGILAVRLDIVANESIHITEAGASGRCNFRPVVRVEIDGGDSGRCPRSVEGEIDDRSAGGFVLLLDDDRDDLLVSLDPEASIFDEDGGTIGPGMLMDGQAATVRGSFNAAGEFVAVAVIVGEVVILGGTVQGPVENGAFPLLTPDGEVAVDVVPETLFLSGCRDPFDPVQLRAGLRARVLGKENGAFKGLVVLVRPGRLVGELVDIVDVMPDGARELDVQVEGAVEPVKVFLAAGEELELPEGTIVPRELVAALVTCAPRAVRVDLDLEDDGVAARVVLCPEMLDGTIEGVPGSDSFLFQVEGSAPLTVLVQPGAEILDLRNGAQEPVDLADIADAGDVRLVGFTDCDDSRFLAFRVLATD